MTFHVMIIPTLNCPSNCKYCWGSENKKEMMDLEIIDEIITWLADLGMTMFISLSMEANRCLQDTTFMRQLLKNCPEYLILTDFHFKATSGF